MSSIPNASQQHMLLENKRKQLMRSTSIDRIMQFNSYICSQSFYPLPAIISWMKSSQTHLDKYILLLKCLILNAVFLTNYKIFLVAVKVFSYCSLLYGKTRTKLNYFLIYLALLITFTQLTVCLYVVFNTCLSLGVVFLITCIHLISYLNLSTSLYYLKTENNNKIRYY